MSELRSSNQLTDILTKPLTVKVFKNLRYKIIKES